MTIAKILLPHDGTEISDRAVDKAKEFAKAFDAELLILHVIEHVPIPPSYILDNERVWIDRTRRSISRILEEAWMKMVQEKLINGLTKENIKATPRVLVGNTINSISDQILKFAKDNQVDLIIMSSERLEKRISKANALGSVSRGVSERASCPVVLIHQ
jgi:nucleotide-binding universal stress UspA family protein